MRRRETSNGIAVLFALALSALPAASASASGATGFTCVKDPTGTLIGAHCLVSGTGEKYKHVDIAQGTTTTGIVTNTNSAAETTAAQSAILKGTAGGVATEIQCTTVTGEGTFENRKSGEEMFAHTEGAIHYTGCSVTAPAGKGCIVKTEGVEGTIKTVNLTGRTVGGGGSVRVEPKEGTTFTEINLEGCSVAGLNKKFPISGAVELKTSGATTTSTHAEMTTANTLKFAGQKAGIEGAVTRKAHSKAGEATNPLSVTATP